MKPHARILFALVLGLVLFAHGCALLPVLVATGAGWWVGTTVMGWLGVLLGAGTAATIVKTWDSIVAWWAGTWFGGGRDALPGTPEVPSIPGGGEGSSTVDDWISLVWYGGGGLLVIATLWWIFFKNRDRIAHLSGDALAELDEHLGPKDPRKPL